MTILLLSKNEHIVRRLSRICKVFFCVELARLENMIRIHSDIFCNNFI